MENQVINARTVLAVNDLAISAAYFIDKLGFERDFAFPGWDFLSFGKSQVILGEFPGAMPARDLGEHAFAAYARVRDVDSLYADLRNWLPFRKANSTGVRPNTSARKLQRRNGRLLEHATTDLDTKSGAEFPSLLVSTIMFGGCAAWLRVIKVN